MGETRDEEKHLSRAVPRTRGKAQKDQPDKETIQRSGQTEEIEKEMHEEVRNRATKADGKKNTPNEREKK